MTDDVVVVNEKVTCDAQRLKRMSARCAIVQSCGWTGLKPVRKSATRGKQTFWCPSCRAWTVQTIPDPPA